MLRAGNLAIFMCRFSSPGNLSFLEHSGPIYICIGIALPFTLNLKKTLKITVLTINVTNIRQWAFSKYRHSYSYLTVRPFRTKISFRQTDYFKQYSTWHCKSRLINVRQYVGHMTHVRGAHMLVLCPPTLPGDQTDLYRVGCSKRGDRKKILTSCKVTTHSISLERLLYCDTVWRLAGSKAHTSIPHVF